MLVNKCPLGNNIPLLNKNPLIVMMLLYDHDFLCPVTIISITNYNKLRWDHLIQIQPYINKGNFITMEHGNFPPLWIYHF